MSACMSNTIDHFATLSHFIWHEKTPDKFEILFIIAFPFIYQHKGILLLLLIKF